MRYFFWGFICIPFGVVVEEWNSSVVCSIFNILRLLFNFQLTVQFGFMVVILMA